MGKLKLNAPKWNGGEPLPGCRTLLSYFAVFAIFIVSCVAIYSHITALLGVLLLYLTNIMFSGLFVKDLLMSAKLGTSDMIALVFFGTIALNLTSSTMVMLTFRKLHATYLKNDETIDLSDKTRNIISVYLTFWILTISMLWVLFAFYFMEQPETPFYNYQFVGQEISPLFMFMGFVIKIVFSLASLGMSGYMVYLAKLFSDSKIKTLA